MSYYYLNGNIEIICCAFLGQSHGILMKKNYYCPIFKAFLNKYIFFFFGFIDFFCKNELF